MDFFYSPLTKQRRILDRGGVNARDPIHLTVTIERKQSDLPRYAIVPSVLVAKWRLDGTTTVDVHINGVPLDRRSIVRWDDERWFVSITQQDCRLTGIDTGVQAALTIAVASSDLPDELATLLQESPEAKQAWDRLSSAQQRMVRETIGSAKQSATRARRARKALLGD